MYLPQFGSTHSKGQEQAVKKSTWYTHADYPSWEFKSDIKELHGNIT